MVKPSWINDQNAWSFLVSLEKIPDLKGIVASISHNSSDWHKWYQNKEIEELPIEWETKCKGTTNIRKLLFAFQLCLETIFSNDEEQKKELEKKGLGKFMSQQKKDEMDEDNPKPKPQMGGMQVYDFFNIQEFSML